MTDSAARKYIDHKKFHRDFNAYLTNNTTTVERIAPNVTLDPKPHENLLLITDISQGHPMSGRKKIAQTSIETLAEALGIPLTYTEIAPPKPAHFEKRTTEKTAGKSGGHSRGGNPTPDSE